MIVVVICRIGLRSGKEPKPRSSFTARQTAFAIKSIVKGKNGVGM